ncbi:hypothetical protein BP5796_03073 [Coleophoma crateriformis]|uniref:Prion-inhibition and propagation HeLo domain-containing protein n=1 Tax=Coleophoma crateriformis TaxID=565419 RepID=A0A3D8SM06_9HELO|nr:hypothetical protein BP5796_03073 [Coleophoma crateriformis]
MDPVSVTLAVLPLLGSVIKAYGLLYKTFKTFHHSSREFCRVRKQVDRQRHFFYNETHILIRPAIEDESMLVSMLEDASHSNWSSTELDVALRRLLGKNYDACLEIIEEIRGAIEELQQQIECLSDVESQRQRGESFKDTLGRIHSRLKITWDKSKFESSITALRSSINDLRCIREQANELQKVNIQLKGRHKPSSQEYSDYRTIRRASEALHVALATVWSKTSNIPSTTASWHNVKLLADAKVDDGVYMNMVVLCYGHESATINRRQPNWTRVRVRSQMLDWVPLHQNTPPCSGESRQKRRKVQFVDNSPTSKISVSTASSTMPLTPECSDTQLRQPDDVSGKDLCSILSYGWPSPSTQSSSCCLEFCDAGSQETFRHSFYPLIDEQRLQSQNSVSMSHVLCRPAEDLLTVVDQLKLARSLVAAVLKFYSTPWLGQYIALNNLSFFGIESEISTWLQTLHFGTDFRGKDFVELDPSPMEGLESTSASFEDAKLLYGIRNPTLWSLGVILLQIGLWSKVDSPDDVLKIRKLSSQAPALGPRYQELTKRCLECDFGYGEDLSKPRLQQAVYENLVCELSDMINSLDISTP